MDYDGYGRIQRFSGSHMSLPLARWTAGKLLLAVAVVTVGAGSAAPIARASASNDIASRAVLSAFRAGLSSRHVTTEEIPARCSVSAPAQLQASDDPLGVRLPGFPPARVPPANVQPLSRAEAERYARIMRGGDAVDGAGPAPSTAPIVATEEAYSAWAQQAGDPMDKFINPSRCVWVVTVQARFVPNAPYGVTLPAHTAYTVIIDVGSHFIIGLTSPHP